MLSSYNSIIASKFRSVHYSSPVVQSWLSLANINTQLLRIKIIIVTTVATHLVIALMYTANVLVTHEQNDVFSIVSFSFSTVLQKNISSRTTITVLARAHSYTSHSYPTHYCISCTAITCTSANSHIPNVYYKKTVTTTIHVTLVSRVLHEWESIVNRVTREEVGEKMIVCGRAARWWDSELKDKISLRREVYKKVIRVGRTYGTNTVDCVRR